MDDKSTPWGIGWRPIIPTTREVKEYGPRNDVLLPILQILAISASIAVNLVFSLATLHAWRRANEADALIVIGIVVCTLVILGFIALASPLEPLYKRAPWLARLTLILILLATAGVGFGFYQLAQSETLLDITIYQASTLVFGVPLSFALAIAMTKEASLKAGLGFLFLTLIPTVVTAYAMPHLALSPGWPYALSVISLSTLVGGVLLIYNFVRERINEWLPLHPMDAWMMEWVKNQKPVPPIEDPSFWLSEEPEESSRPNNRQLRLPHLLSPHLPDVLAFVRDALDDRLAVDQTLPRTRFHEIAVRAEAMKWIKLRNPTSRKDGYTCTPQGETIFKSIKARLDKMELE